MLQVIQQNQQQFVQMLNDPEAGSGGGGGGSGGPAPPAGGGGGSQEYIQVTPEEKAAIERVSRYLLLILSSFVPLSQLVAL